MNGLTIGSMALALVFVGNSYGAAAQDAGTPRTRNYSRITIRINDYAQVKPTVLLQAERTAGDILRRSGVKTVWADCLRGQTFSGDPACASPMTSLDFVLTVLPRSMSQPLRMQEEVLGRALGSDGKDFAFFAYILYDHVKDGAGQLDLGRFLGDVFAHELGHLLLGTNSHSSRGLMRAFWSGKDLLLAEQRGGLSFSSAEMQRIHTALIARKLADLRAVESREALLAPKSETGSITR